MKTILAMAVLLACSLALSAWLSGTASQEGVRIAGSAPASAPEGHATRDSSGTAGIDRLLQDISSRNDKVQSAQMAIVLTVKAGGSTVIFTSQVEMENPRRLYFKSTVLGQATESFTDGSRVCVRRGTTWSQAGTQPMLAGSANQLLGFVPSRSLTRGPDRFERGEDLIYLSGTLSAAELRNFLSVSGAVTARPESAQVEYLVGKKDYELRRTTISFSYEFNGVPTETTQGITYSRLNQPANIPSYVPQACADPARTF